MTWLFGIVVLAIVAGAVWLWYQARRAGRQAVELGQAKTTIEEVGDAADVRHAVDAATPDERQRLRDKWARKP
jgi:hypothetical protein